MKFLLALLAATLLSCDAQQEGEKNKKIITATEYKENHANTKDAILVDVRTPAEFKAGHLQKAKNSDFLSGQFQDEMQHWDKSKTYYLYCATGNRSGKAAKLMKEAGFESVYNIGGYKELKEAGIPVETEED